VSEERGVPIPHCACCTVSSEERRGEAGRPDSLLEGVICRQQWIHCWSGSSPGPEGFGAHGTQVPDASGE